MSLGVRPDRRLPWPLFLLALTALLLAPPPAAAKDSRLVSALDQAVRGARRSAPQLGVHITDAATGGVVYSKDPDVVRIVASNTKLFTTAAALEYLGPGYQVTTRVYVRGKRAGDTLLGDLGIVGGGDPNISGRHHQGDSLAVFRGWARELRRRGIETISGDLYLADGNFDSQLVHPDWPRDQLGKWYEAPVAALSFNDNCVLVRVLAGAGAGAPARVALLPDVPVLEVRNLTRTTNSSRRHRISIDRSAATGRRAFSGRTVHQTLDLIMSDDPQPVREIRPDLSPDVDRVVRKCLGKSVDRRYQIADELVVDIRLLQDDIAAGVAVSAVSPQASSIPGGKRRVPRLLAAAVIGGLVTGIVAWNLTGSGESTSPPVTRFSVFLPAGQELTGNMRDQVALSRDGAYLAYVADNQLYLRAMNQLETEPIPGTDGAENPFFSPNGQWLGFWQADQLMKVGVQGGPVNPLADSPDPNGATWGADDTILFARETGEPLRGAFSCPWTP